MSFLNVVKDLRGEVAEHVRESAMEALEDAANELLRVANDTVPYEEGTLQGSGEVSTDPSQLKARVAYGGEGSLAEPYALRQHEDVTFVHKGKGRAKWLELAAQENAARLGVSIGMGIRERLS